MRQTKLQSISPQKYPLWDREKVNYLNNSKEKRVNDLIRRTAEMLQYMAKLDKT